MGDKKKKKNSGIARFFDVIFSLALLAGVGWGGYYIVTHGTAVEQKTNYTDNITEETTEETTEPGTVYNSIEISNQEVYNGSLILVNSEYPFQGSEENLVSLYQVMLEKDCHSFGGANSAEVKVQQEYAEKLIEMFDAFYNATYDNNVIVQSGYRSAERQQELYDADLQKNNRDYSDTVAKAGYSEHQTGWGVDLTLYQADYDGTGIYSWIGEHCAEFGIILRYPEDKTSVTNIIFEPWHYRYVGQPHSDYITASGLCLEEYITLLYGYPYEGEHLIISAEKNGIYETYEVYYYPADTSADTTMLPVPADKEYTVSGNNIDGFIVAVDTGETAVPATETNDTPEDEPNETETVEEVTE
ncbi:MAG: D-alanyl-D-alanine carboxypeptidase family protein [Ruminococcus sp.]|nr:D-alanyl-D-alanine carboxypeptidase family protein [Ruminococcus sp.]